MAVAVITGSCQGCGACLITCPEHALAAAPGAPVVHAAACTACGECEEICPVDAITITFHAAGDHISGQNGAPA